MSFYIFTIFTLRDLEEVADRWINIEIKLNVILIVLMVWCWRHYIKILNILQLPFHLTFSKFRYNQILLTPTALVQTSRSLLDFRPSQTLLILPNLWNYKHFRAENELALSKKSLCWLKSFRTITIHCGIREKLGRVTL